MNSKWKSLGVGILGGMIPMGMYLFFAQPYNTSLSDEVIDGNKDYYDLPNAF